MRHVPEKSTGKTRTTRDGAAPSPRLPHERDESSDTGSTPAQPIERAHDDVERGLRETDRGEATDDAYRRQKGGAPE